MAREELLLQADPTGLDEAGRARILIVDDDHDQTDILAVAFRRQGYEAVTAHSLTQAEAAVDRDEPQLIIMDVRLPDGDGLNMCRTLSDDEETCDIPVIILTASDQPDIVRSARAAGCHFFLHKPYDPSALLLLAENALTERRGW